jgi:hypothetical protein
MIRILLTETAFSAIVNSLPDDAHLFEKQYDPNTGHVVVWLLRATVNQLRANRRYGEDWSDIVLRLADHERTLAECP